MSISYCEDCDKYVDWDIDVEHFDQDGKCVRQQVEKLLDEGFDGEEISDALFDLNLTLDDW